MNLKNFGVIILLSILNGFNLTVLAEESLADVVKARAENAKENVQNSQSAEIIPGYSEKEKQQEEKKLANIQVDNKADNLRIAGAQARDRAVRNNPDGAVATMVEATDISKVTGDKCKHCAELHKHNMFQKADEYMQDPIGQMELIKNEGCKEIEDNTKKGYFIEDKVDTYTDAIEELRICERPITSFKCQKTLSVYCKRTDQCDFGGITKGSISEGMTFDASNGFLTIGTDGDNYLGGECATHEKSISFHIAQASLVSVFQLVHVKFYDYIQLELNGHIFYVGPDGGDYVKVQSHEIEVEKERTIYKWKDTLVAKLKEKKRSIFAYSDDDYDYWFGPWKEKYKEKISITEVFNGHEYKPCERETSWDKETDIDLKSYLKDGENILKMKILVSGGGEGWLKIKAKQQCCADDQWQETWEEGCE